MMRRIWIAYCIELFKAIRTKTSLAGPALVVLSVLSVTMLHPVCRDGQSDYAFVAEATSLVLDLLVWLLLVCYCAGLVAPEIGGGTARMLLTRPLLRLEFLAAKFLHGITYACVLTGLTAGAVWSVAALGGDLMGVGFGGETLYTGREMVRTYMLAAFVGLAPQIATVAYGIMMSSFTKSTGAATVMGLGIWLVADLAKHPLGLAPFVFSTYIESPWRVFTSRVAGFPEAWMPGAVHCVAASAFATVAFLAVAAAVLQRRNLLT